MQITMDISRLIFFTSSFFSFWSHISFVRVNLIVIYSLNQAELAVSKFSGNGAGILAAASTVISTFLLVFVAEWGDKSFFSTIGELHRSRSHVNRFYLYLVVKLLLYEEIILSCYMFQSSVIVLPLTEYHTLTFLFF